MLDAALRPLKDRLLDPVVRLLVRWVRPNHVTVAAFLVGIGAAGSAAARMTLLALVLWLINRIMDGLDGAIARAGGTQSDLGGYLDIVLDFVVYAAIPAGVAYGAAVPGRWRALALLFAVFYVNGASWMYLSALLEKRANRSSGAVATSVVMPSGVVEGTETIVGFSALFLFPEQFVFIAVLMSALTMAGAVQRVVWGVRNL